MNTFIFTEHSQYCPYISHFSLEQWKLCTNYGSSSGTHVCKCLPCTTFVDWKDLLLQSIAPSPPFPAIQLHWLLTYPEKPTLHFNALDNLLSPHFCKRAWSEPTALICHHLLLTPEVIILPLTTLLKRVCVSPPSKFEQQLSLGPFYA